MKVVKIWTDGSCYPNPGPGGWGAVLIYKAHKKMIFGGDNNTTNNKMEMLAAVKALEQLTEPCKVILHTDSQYLQNGMMRWARSWAVRGWRTASGSAVKNTDLWKRLLELDGVHQITYVWVRGHDGNPNNEIADRLALKGRLAGMSV